MTKTPERPDTFTCLECKEEGKYRLHTALTKDLPDGEWSWEILNHDTTPKFQWPKSFESKKVAQTHLNSMIGLEEGH